MQLHRCVCVTLLKKAIDSLHFEKCKFNSHFLDKFGGINLYIELIMFEVSMLQCVAIFKLTTDFLSLKNL